MTTALEGGERSEARPGRTLPQGKSRYPLYRRLGRPQGQSGRAENLAPPGFDPRTVQPVAQPLYRLSYPAHYSGVSLFIQIRVTAQYIKTINNFFFNSENRFKLIRTVNKQICFCNISKFKLHGRVRDSIQVKYLLHSLANGQSPVTEEHNYLHRNILRSVQLFRGHSQTKNYLRHTGISIHYMMMDNGS